MSPHIRPAQPLVLGFNYREMRVAETNGKNRFQLLEDVVFHYDTPIYEGRHQISFRDHRGREWVRLTPTSKTIRAYYSWNGCSPKKGVTVFGKDFWFGTPDFEATRMGSLNHDADFQFCQTPDFPLSWGAVNRHFYSLLKQNSFRLANAYYGALEDFSKKVWNGKTADGIESVIL